MGTMVSLRIFSGFILFPLANPNGSSAMAVALSSILRGVVASKHEARGGLEGDDLFNLIYSQS